MDLSSRREPTNPRPLELCFGARATCIEVSGVDEPGGSDMGPDVDDGRFPPGPLPKFD